jgi:hypothetical protein
LNWGANKNRQSGGFLVEYKNMENQTSQPKKFSKLALASFICIIFGLFIIFICGMTRLFPKNWFTISLGYFGLLILVLSPIFGIWAEVQIKKNKGELKGEWLSRISVIFSIAFWIILVLFLTSL